MNPTEAVTLLIASNYTVTTLNDSNMIALFSWAHQLCCLLSINNDEPQGFEPQVTQCLARPSLSSQPKL